MICVLALPMLLFIQKKDEAFSGKIFKLICLGLLFMFMGPLMADEPPDDIGGLFRDGQQR